MRNTTGTVLLTLALFLAIGDFSASAGASSNSLDKDVADLCYGYAICR